MPSHLLSTLVLAGLLAGPFAEAVAAGIESGHHNAVLSLTLDNGSKWVADQHTVDAVASMGSTVRGALDRKPEAALPDLHTTGAELQEQLQSLIRGCTMTGDAHHQLHTWISLVAPEIERVVRAERTEAARASASKIAGLVESFDVHFQAAAK